MDADPEAQQSRGLCFAAAAQSAAAVPIPDGGDSDADRRKGGPGGAASQVQLGPWAARPEAVKSPWTLQSARQAREQGSSKLTRAAWTWCAMFLLMRASLSGPSLGATWAMKSARARVKSYTAIAGHVRRVRTFFADRRNEP